MSCLKILEGPRSDASLRALEMLGVFPYLLPELTTMKGVEQSAPHVHDVWEHTLSVMQNLESILSALAPSHDAEKTNDLFSGLLTLRLGPYREQFAAHFNQSLNADRSMRALLFFAALYHDISKPATKSVEETGRIQFFGHDTAGAKVAIERAHALNLSNDEIERLKIIIANHMRFHFFTSQMESEKKETIAQIYLSFLPRCRRRRRGFGFAGSRQFARHAQSYFDARILDGGIRCCKNFA